MGNHSKYTNYNYTNWHSFCSKGRLRELYSDRVMTLDEIAELFGVTVKRVYTAMRRFGIARRSRAVRDQYAEKNPGWKGDSVGYKGAHCRLNRLKGQPKKCENCKTADPAKRYEWASMSGRYADPADYKRLCALCHRRLDGNGRKGAETRRKKHN